MNETYDFMNIAASWKSFSGHSRGEDVPEEVWDIAKRCFYAGAAGVLKAQANIIEAHKESQEARLILLKALSNEIYEFQESLECSTS